MCRALGGARARSTPAPRCAALPPQDADRRAALPAPEQANGLRVAEFSDSDVEASDEDEEEAGSEEEEGSEDQEEGSGGGWLHTHTPLRGLHEAGRSALLGWLLCGGPGSLRLAAQRGFGSLATLRGCCLTALCPAEEEEEESSGEEGSGSEDLGSEEEAATAVKAAQAGQKRKAEQPPSAAKQQPKQAKQAGAATPAAAGKQQQGAAPAGAAQREQGAAPATAGKQQQQAAGKAATPAKKRTFPNGFEIEDLKMVRLEQGCCCAAAAVLVRR